MQKNINIKIEKDLSQQETVAEVTKQILNQLQIKYESINQIKDSSYSNWLVTFPEVDSLFRVNSDGSIAVSKKFTDTINSWLK